MERDVRHLETAGDDGVTDLQGTRIPILYTSTSYLPAIGGAQLHSHFTLLHLRRTYDFRVVTLWSENRTDWLLGSTLRAHSQTVGYEVDGVPVVRLGFAAGHKLRMLPGVAVYYLLQEFGIRTIASVIEDGLTSAAREVAIVHNARIGREPISYASLSIARRRKVPFVFTPYHHPRWEGWFYRHFHNIYLQADALIAMTHAERDCLVRMGVGEERIHVSGMAPVLAQEARAQEFLERMDIRQPFVLFLGQFFKYKGYRQLLEAAPLVWRRLPDVSFVFIGPDAAGSGSVFKSVEGPRIHRLGAVDLQTKTNALSACSLLCVPSTQESFGGVYTEAWAMGKPVIGCPIPSVAELVQHGVDGLLVSQRKEEIADAIIYLLENESLAEQMGERGRRKVRERYTWDRCAAGVRKAYESVLRKRR